MSIRVGLFFSIIALSGCANFSIPSTENYKEILQSWVGSAEYEIVKSWGPPQQFYDAGGGVRYLTYSNTRNVTRRGTPVITTTTVNPYLGTATSTTTGGTAAESYTLSCQTTFEIQDGYIVHWKLKGNDCTAKRPE